ncbi:MAG: helix-turn-helix domain-containing protein [Holosporales bacterium]|jgi:IS30 family transposase|nr:helix-turn-helix domain-containing protein [Holosporales bacterium]
MRFLGASPLMKNYWTKEEIAILKEKYSSGQRIKAIAKELGRTPSAINKTISRLGIARRIVRIDVKRNITLQCKVKYAVHDDPDVYLQKSVSFATIEKYLKEKGFRISRFRDSIYQTCHNNEKEMFKVGNIPMTKMKVLLFANRIRIEEKKPVFSSKDITWY